MSKIACILILVTGFFLSSCSDSQPKQACFGKSCFNLELAATPEQRDQGLMFRKELSPDKGMLFIFEEEGNHCFWMKDTLIPLDMIWLNSNREVVHIAKNVQPCKTESCPNTCPGVNAKYALEINAGISDSIGLRLGDSLFLD